MFWKSGYFVKIRDSKHFGLYQAATPRIAVELPSQAAICKSWSKISDFKIENCLKLRFQGLPSQIQVKQLTVSFQSYHSFRRLAS